MLTNIFTFTSLDMVMWHVDNLLPSCFTIMKYYLFLLSGWCQNCLKMSELNGIKWLRKWYLNEIWKCICAEIFKRYLHKTSKAATDLTCARYFLKYRTPLDNYERSGSWWHQIVEIFTMSCSLNVYTTPNHMAEMCCYVASPAMMSELLFFPVSVTDKLPAVYHLSETNKTLIYVQKEIAKC